MSTITPFNQLGIAPSLLSSLSELGYETPTPIQARSIPILMEGDDLLAQAQTGTGKTAAFALPVLSNLNPGITKPQALVIVPTRELAIQVAEAFQRYAKHLKGFHVAPIYGGQDYRIQLRALKRGAHVVVGTPGRVMDHLRRGTLSMDALKTVVLDEADEMLKMGFIEDIEWILEQIPQAHQTALFSATIPASIQKISTRYLKDAKRIHIKPKAGSVETIEQCYTLVSKNQKLELLTRFLEVEDIQASIIFVRTKNETMELTEKLRARGYAAAALNGDMNQSLREKVISRFKSGVINLVVATDVAARGIDVDRVSHVINYDIPYDAESYIHRIGRTGRAGRKGKAFLFVTPRERRLLKDIERVINKPILQIQPPSVDAMKEKRAQQLAEKVMGILAKSKKLGPYHEMIEDILAKNNCTAKEVASALAYLIEQNNPLASEEMLVEETPEPRRRRRERPSRSRFNRKPSKAHHQPRAQKNKQKSSTPDPQKNRASRKRKR